MYFEYFAAYAASFVLCMDLLVSLILDLSDLYEKLFTSHFNEFHNS